MPARSVRLVRICRGDDSSPLPCKSQKFYYIEKNRVISEEITRFFHFKEALLFSTRVLYRNSTSWPWKSRKLFSFAELT